MRSIKDIVRLSFKTKERGLANTTIVRKVKEGDEMVEKEFPRVEREILIPETHDELLVAIGGESNFGAFCERVWTDYSASVAKAEMNKLSDTSSDAIALQKYLSASSNFSFANVLTSESKSEKVNRALQQTDTIGTLTARFQAGEFSAEQFALEVQKVMGLLRA
jgi:hypothetical protein